MSSKLNIGIIGFGELGKLAAKHLKDHAKIFVSDCINKKENAKKEGVEWTTIEEASRKEVVIIAVPINAFEKTLHRIKDNVTKNSLIIDVCSVKVKPAKLMKKILPQKVEIIATHPLFGPQSGANGITGLKIVLCPIRTTRLEKVRKFIEQKLKLHVIITTPEEHDKQSAKTGALAHVIGRVLMKMNSTEQQISEPSFNKLIELKKIVEKDSFELFKDIQTNNPFAQKMRKELLRSIVKIEKRLQ